MPITMVRKGETVVVRRITGSASIREHLASLGFTIGSPVRIVCEVAGRLVLQISGSQIALEKSMADRIII